MIVAKQRRIRNGAPPGMSRITITLNRAIITRRLGRLVGDDAQAGDTFGSSGSCCHRDGESDFALPDFTGPSSGTTVELDVEPSDLSVATL